MARKDIDTLIRISRTVGEDPDLVSGAGGNTSAKDAQGKVMWVKASGTTLGSMERGKGYVEVKLDAVRAILDDGLLAGMASEKRDSLLKERLTAAMTKHSPEGRPSVETFLHAILDRYVVHTHPALVCGMLSSKKGVQALASKETLVVPYVDPGFPLALLIREEIEKWRQKHRGKTPAIILMENHGLLISAPDPDEAVTLTYRFLGKARTLLKKRAAAARRKKPVGTPVSGMLALRRSLFKKTGRRFMLRFVDSYRTRRLLSRKGGSALVATPLVPDQIAYCGLAPLVVRRNAAEDFRQYVKRIGVPPKIALFPESGFVVIGAGPDDVKNKAVIWRDVERMLETTLEFGGPRHLGKRDAEYIASWEAEAYRRSLMEKGKGGPLDGRVAVVTGAGSGLGRGIALGFLRAGALVAMLDVNPERLDEARAEAAQEFGKGRILPLVADVTNEKDVRRAFRRTVARFGGVDVLLNAASIAPSHPLADFPAESWRKALEINLTGYFLTAREAARIMIEQQMGGSIINLSSKTGLDASKNNSAYNATKAGELHLARGWALELGEHAIRVNSLAPGNVFEGSMIWNKEYIKACARKRGIKPEEVIPYYVNLTALKQEIKPEDVADAAVFLASDKASKITGQTIVPDAGQVFVR